MVSLRGLDLHTYFRLGVSGVDGQMVGMAGHQKVLIVGSMECGSDDGMTMIWMKPYEHTL